MAWIDERRASETLWGWGWNKSRWTRTWDNPSLQACFSDCSRPSIDRYRPSSSCNVISLCDVGGQYTVFYPETVSYTADGQTLHSDVTKNKTVQVLFLNNSVKH